jgi:hypothetical protein
MIDCTALMSAMALPTFASAISCSSIAVDRLLIGRFGLIRPALAFVQGVGRLVEARLRRIAMLGQLADPIVSWPGPRSPAPARARPCAFLSEIVFVIPRRFIVSGAPPPASAWRWQLSGLGS